MRVALIVGVAELPCSLGNPSEATGLGSCVFSPPGVGVKKLVPGTVLAEALLGGRAPAGSQTLKRQCRPRGPGRSRCPGGGRRGPGQDSGSVKQRVPGPP